MIKSRGPLKRQHSGTAKNFIATRLEGTSKVVITQQWVFGGLCEKKNTTSTLQEGRNRLPSHYRHLQEPVKPPVPPFRPVTDNHVETTTPGMHLSASFLTPQVPSPAPPKLFQAGLEELPEKTARPALQSRHLGLAACHSALIGAQVTAPSPSLHVGVSRTYRRRLPTPPAWA